MRPNSLSTCSWLMSLDEGESDETEEEVTPRSYQERYSRAEERLTTPMRGILINSLLAVQKVMINDKHCFEVYGYDILVSKTQQC